MSTLEENHLTNNPNISLDIEKKSKKALAKGVIFRLFILAIITVMLALHMSELFMGKNSVEVYFDLNEKKIDLKDEIIRLKDDNAKLQKELFELKSLEPDEQIKEDFKNIIKNEEDK